MKIQKKLFISFTLLLISLASYPQDNRTIETKVADLLARLPANDLQFNDKLMEEMLSLGETGIKQICDQIIPAGTGDDTRPRFAVESLSRFLSQKGKESEKEMGKNLYQLCYRAKRQWCQRFLHEAASAYRWRSFC
jgi:hypothetical protein